MIAKVFVYCFPSKIFNYFYKNGFRKVSLYLRQNERDRMKKLDLFVLKTYLGPLVMTFFIALFILLMQFVWKYIDDLVGKGLEWYVIL